MHEFWLGQLPHYVAGTLEQAEREVLEAHLRACDTCRAAAREWAVIAAAVRAEVDSRAWPLPALRQPDSLSRHGQTGAPASNNGFSASESVTTSQSMEDSLMEARVNTRTAAPTVARIPDMPHLRPAPPRRSGSRARRAPSALTLAAAALLIVGLGAAALLLVPRLDNAPAPGANQPAGLGAQVDASTPTPPPSATPLPLRSPAPGRLSPAQMTATPIIEPLPPDLAVTPQGEGDIEFDIMTPTPIPAGSGQLLPPTVSVPAPPPLALDANLPPQAAIEGVRYERQTWNNSGPAALAMALSALGWQGDQAEAARWLRAEGDDKSVMLWEMVRFVEQQTEFGALYRMGGVPALLRQLVAAGFPVVIPVGFEPDGEDWLGHHWVVAGYDDAAQTFLVYDSYQGEDEPIEMPNAELDAAWRQFNRAFLVVFRPEDRAEALLALASYVSPSTGWLQAWHAAVAEQAATPGDAWAAFNMGAALSALGDYWGAAQAFDQALALGLPWRTLRYRPDPYAAYYAVGRFDTVGWLAAQQSMTEEGAYWQGMVYAVGNGFDRAREQFDAVLEANPNYLPAQAARIEIELAALDVPLFAAGAPVSAMGRPYPHMTTSQGATPAPALGFQALPPGVMPVVTVTAAFDVEALPPSVVPVPVTATAFPVVPPALNPTPTLAQ